MIPGMWVTIMKLFLVIAQPQIFLLYESHDNDLHLPVLLTECTAVILPVRTFKYVSLTLPQTMQAKVCRTVGPSLAASLEALAYCQNVASLSLFCRYYFHCVKYHIFT